LAVAAIALGSNLPSPAGDRAATLHSAVRALGLLGEVIAVSTFFDTDPVGYLDQPLFLNAAALLRTELGPLNLLHALMTIERDHGRDRSAGIAKGPRTLDLDLLLYDDFVMVTPELTVPHPEMHRRAFVLEPLAEIAPDLWHPAQHATVSELLRRLQ
jgi:2-amino-4-hydroxy-6-hydroxymethyldihydropteridine diphosphokinase